MSSVIPDNSAVPLKALHKRQPTHMALMSIVPQHSFVTVSTTKTQTHQSGALGRLLSMASGQLEQCGAGAGLQQRVEHGRHASASPPGISRPLAPAHSMRSYHERMRSPLNPPRCSGCSGQLDWSCRQGILPEQHRTCHQRPCSQPPLRDGRRRYYHLSSPGRLRARAGAQARHHTAS